MIILSANYVIGIDLGTTNTVFAYIVPNIHGYYDVSHIDNPDGKELTPSVVYFEKINDNFIVGEAALREYIVSPDRTFRWIKRKMGTKESYVIEMSQGIRTFLPQDISACILSYLKTYTESKLELDEEINSAVITVPAYFGDNEKQATIDAAKIAGFSECTLIEEPSAAILDYIFGKDQQKRLNEEFSDNDNFLAVFDLGGGTFDISIAKVNINGRQINIEIIAKDGDKYLGGYDFDLDLAEFVLNKAANQNPQNAELFNELKDLLIEYKHKFINTNDEEKLWIIANIIDEAERVKISLSSKQQHKFRIPRMSVIRNAYNVEVSRSEFDEILSKYISKIDICIDRALKQAQEITNGKLESIDRIKTAVLIGGSTRIPAINDYVTRKFTNTSIAANLDKSVARGAAIKAAIDKNIKIFESINFGLRTSHSYGFINDGIFESIIDRGEVYPCTKNKVHNLPFVLDTKIPINIAQEYIDTNGTRCHDTIKEIDFYHPFLYTGDEISIDLKIDDNGMINIMLKDNKTDEDIEEKSLALGIKEIEEKSLYTMKNMSV